MTYKPNFGWRRGELFQKISDLSLIYDWYLISWYKLNPQKYRVMLIFCESTQAKSQIWKDNTQLNQPKDITGSHFVNQVMIKIKLIRVVVGIWTWKCRGTKWSVSHLLRQMNKDVASKHCNSHIYNLAESLAYQTKCLPEIFSGSLYSEFKSHLGQHCFSFLWTC